MGIRWGNINNGIPSPTDDIFIKTALEGGKRLLSTSKIRRQKEPFTTTMVKQVVDLYGSDGNLLHLRFAVTCLLGFSGFLRIEELLDIQMHHLHFSEDCLRITIPKSKTDQLRDGHIVYISRTFSRYCPVASLARYIRLTGLDVNPTNFLLCRLAKTRTGHNAQGHLPISYSCMRDNFRQFVHPMFPDTSPSSYGLPSFRSGGATTAVNNDISERLIGKHGD